MEGLTLKSNKPKIAVIGDVMLDVHTACRYVGLTPECDSAPRLSLIDTSEYLGGAANVAHNLKTLGADVHLFGVIGRDERGKSLKFAVDKLGIKHGLYWDERKTTVKHRYLYTSESSNCERSKYVCRIDDEDTHPVDAAITGLILKNLPSDIDIVIVSDYAKGVVTSDIISGLGGRPYLVDPKRKDLEFYGEALVLTPNSLEARGSTDHVGKALLVTEGLHGARLQTPAGYEGYTAAELSSLKATSFKQCRFTQVSVRGRPDGEVTGCGDSSIAGLAYGLSSGLTLLQSTKVAMACGACAVDRNGAHPVSLESVLEELQRKEYEYGS